MSDVRAETAGAVDLHAKALEAIFAALADVAPGAPPASAESAPETVLIGEGGLDSLAFVTFVVALEERLQAIGSSVSVMDVVPVDGDGCTADELAARIADAVGRHAR